MSGCRFCNPVEDQRKSLEHGTKNGLNIMVTASDGAPRIGSFHTPDGIIPLYAGEAGTLHIGIYYKGQQLEYFQLGAVACPFCGRRLTDA